MQVILLERVENLGRMGEEVKVRDGYARNFLLPRKKALRASPQNRAYFEAQKQDIEARNLAQRGEAEDAAKGLEGASCTLIRQAGELGQLYGSVSARDIVIALGEGGYKVDRGQIVLNRPIKSVGMHEVKVALHPEVSVTVIVNVARTVAEAREQEKGEESPAEAFFDSPEVAKDALEADTEADDEAEDDRA